MTGPLALVGGGEFSEGCTFDAELLAAVGATEVTLLATGWAYENPQKSVAVAREWFAKLGATVREVPVYTRTDALDADNVSAVANAKFLYLTGVSPMHIRSVLKDTPTYDALLSSWRGGAALVGSGAGADVLCDPMVDTRGGAFTVGLGLLPGVAVIARSDEWSPDKVRRTIDLASAGVVLLELPTCTAVIDDIGTGGWRVAGKGNVIVHRDGKLSDISALPEAVV
ncbi:MAG: Type 1 glutamine amidotransferase-like domain-containing protein [Actinobacteria bacterium]|nr:Type 1 glutamine amidotransferase-like domain-containing protein [Actinomycetota bacterium]